MEDLENGLNEQGLIDFVKTVLLSGNNPRGKEAVENLKWGIKQYRKQLILHGVVKSLKGKKAMSFGVWKIECKDIEYIDRKLLKYKGNLMSYEELEKEYHKINHTL